MTITREKAEAAVLRGLNTPAPPPTPPRDPRFVYFILSSETNRMKIGIAADPWERLDTLRTGSPEELLLVAFIPATDARCMEREWHDRFAEDRLRGEWFNATLGLAQAVLTEASRDWDHLKRATGRYRGLWERPDFKATPEETPAQLPASTPLPKGTGRKAALARYKLARGIVD